MTEAAQVALFADPWFRSSSPFILLIKHILPYDHTRVEEAGRHCDEVVGLITAARTARSARLLVGSIPGSSRRRNRTLWLWGMRSGTTTNTPAKTEVTNSA